MCGIGGYLGDRQHPRPLDEAALTLRHRGPDAQGAARFQTQDGSPGYLAAARLSILDPSPAADQPMASRDGQVRLVYNGEIYNHDALRRELTENGAQFRSHSDTEVVLEGYRQLGASLWARLRGMFAFALWDGAQQALWLVRDAMGIKPLYYAARPERLVFASELRSLIAAGACDRRIDLSSLAGFLAWGSVGEPQTVLAGVKLLPPGHALRVTRQAGRVITSPPTTFTAQAFVPASPMPSREALIASLSVSLQTTVTTHLQSDVPIGLLLSGGVDSTALAMLARDGSRRSPLTAFTLAAAGARLDEEAQRAAETARILGLPHTIYEVSAEQALAAAPRFLAALDQPTVDGFNTFLICEAVRAAGCKLVLSGLGGDELFSGYALHRLFAGLWRFGGPAANLIAKEPWFSAALYRRLRGLFSPLTIRALLRRDLRAFATPPALIDDGEAQPGDGFTRGLLRVQELDRRNYLVNTLLRDGDVMSMAHGVELRVPLCDRELWRAVIGGGPAGQLPRKALLVEAAAAAVKDSAAVAQLRAIAHEKKRGFVLPFAQWLAGPLGVDLRARFDHAQLVAAAGLSRKSLARLLSVYDRAPSPLRRRLSFRLWAIYVLLSFVEQHGLRVD